MSVTFIYAEKYLEYVWFIL